MKEATRRRLSRIALTLTTLGREAALDAKDHLERREEPRFFASISEAGTYLAAAAELIEISEDLNA